MSLLKIENASFQYGKSTIFQNISFELGSGSIFCLFGPNGCGKSTLIECILGYLKLSGGSILLNNQSISSYRPAELAKSISYVPQSHAKNFPYTVKDIVLMGRAAYTGTFSAPSAEDIAIAESALESMGLTAIKDKPYTQLSGGQTQLVMLARALTQETPIILMDEPTAHLDFRHELIILETIVKLIKENNISVVMATHFPNHAFYFENSGIHTQVALMNNQALEAIGSPVEVLTEANMLKTFKIHAKLMTAQTAGEKLVRGLIPIEVSS
ncbi:ABC transporter ATP-binding protein [Neobacillus niacini]|uniref:ABC transporter ATP-binding protein n=1 Tax=Neobacillus niacini TaxID=86668 RepID=UPI0021CB2203|nr:ABC transporter ATP-binding protein [Neobacillus niacini]MCM3763673.1 ABC transporter ATP-binding protein [Neobacillus niacini]